MRVLVVTVVHHPQDARIAHRQIPALLAAGHEVTYAAPFRATGAEPPPGVRAVDVARAVGRRRLAALTGARRAVALHAPDADVVLVHDPELVPALAGLSLPTRVWDVHEDTAAAVGMKGWLPRPLGAPAAAAVGALERRAERGWHLLLAEDGYRTRFAGDHPVVPNTTYVPESVPEPGDHRVVYLGNLTVARGALDLVAVAERLAGTGVEVHLVGGADAAVRPALERAHSDGVLRWHGFVPNTEALTLVEGALAGLSLLHDEPNYRHSMPTKVVEYMARGVPVVTTPTPPAQALVERHACGVVVPFADPAAAADAVLALRDDATRRRALGAAGHAAAAEHLAWPAYAKEFVTTLEAWARSG